MKLLTGVWTLFTLALFSCSDNDTTTDSGNTGTPLPRTPLLNYTVTGTYPHDTSSFTEGLLFYKGDLLESTGNYGQSKLLRYDLKTGRVQNEIKLQDSYFGEGLTVLHDTLYQLTWKEKTVLVYTKDFKMVKSLTLPIEGWGLTTDSTHLIASDGSSNLYFFEPSTFRLLRTQGVTENGMPISNINELEYIDGVIYANVWQTNTILKIDVNSGQVVGKMDLTELERRAKAKNPKADVLNGIAYHPETKKLYVTGKNWPELFEIQL